MKNELSKKKILKQFKNTNINYNFLCNFMENYNLRTNMREYLFYEGILLNSEYTINELFISEKTEDVYEEAATFRYMVLEDFLTKQGIK